MLNTNVSFTNAYEGNITEHLTNEITNANADAKALQKILDYIDTIIAKCKPMPKEELEQLLK